MLCLKSDKNRYSLFQGKCSGAANADGKQCPQEAENEDECKREGHSGCSFTPAVTPPDVRRYVSQSGIHFPR